MSDPKTSKEVLRILESECRPSLLDKDIEKSGEIVKKMEDIQKKMEGITKEHLEREGKKIMYII